MINRKTKVSIDWFLISLFFGIVVIGWVLLYTASYEGTGAWFNFSSVVGRQSIWILVSIVAFLLVYAIDWRVWNSLSYPIYIIGVLSLLVVLFFGKEVKGASSWFNIMGYSIQPSEFAKFGTALALASFLGQTNLNLEKVKSAFYAFIIFLAPAFLIFVQPDAGTAIVFFAFLVPLFRAGLNASLYLLTGSLAFIFIGSLLWSPSIMFLIIMLVSFIIMTVQKKENRVQLGVILLLTLLCVASFNFINYWILFGLLFLSGFYFSYFLFKEGRYKQLIIISSVAFGSMLLSFGTQWAFDNILKPHQRARLNVWLKPHLSDPRGDLYNIIQSKTAIGSGGFWGKGFLDGTMTKLNYVPEQHTDFVFSILGEEHGFVGALFLILLFTLLILRICAVAERSSFTFIRYYAYGIAGLLFVHFFVNIGMTMGIMPVIGIPLPLVSKGGSSLLAFSIMIGVLVKMDLARAR